jgi:hypothetical protein
MTATTQRRAREALVAGAVVAAAAHVPVIGEHLREAPYMGVLFAVFTVACAGLAAVAMARPNAAVYAAAASLCGGAVAVYAATRLVAFPQLADDLGDWFTPLGMVSVAAELVVVASALVLRPVAEQRA